MRHMLSLMKIKKTRKKESGLNSFFVISNKYSLIFSVSILEIKSAKYVFIQLHSEPEIARS